LGIRLSRTPFQFWKKYKKMIKTLKIEILWDVVMLCNLVIRKKLTNMNFNILCKNTSCFDKTAMNFAYERRTKKFLYEKLSAWKITSEFNRVWPFTDF
jgi:hypothetical protein